MLKLKIKANTSSVPYRQKNNFFSFFFSLPNRTRLASWQLFSRDGVEEIDAEEGVGAGQALAPSSYRLRSVLRHGRVRGFRV
jgi:hypothetical protein